MILVTGATGIVGREVVRALSGTGQTFMVMIRSEAARERLERAGIPIVATDCDEPAQPNVALIGTLVRNSDSGRAGAYQSAKGCEDRRAGRKLVRRFPWPCQHS